MLVSIRSPLAPVCDTFMKRFRTQRKTRLIFYAHLALSLIWLILLIAAPALPQTGMMRITMLVLGMISGLFLLLLRMWMTFVIDLRFTPERFELRRLMGVPRHVVRWSEIEKITFQADEDIRIERKGAHPIWLGIGKAAGISEDAVFEALRE